MAATKDIKSETAIGTIPPTSNSYMDEYYIVVSNKQNDKYLVVYLWLNIFSSSIPSVILEFLIIATHLIRPSSRCRLKKKFQLSSGGGYIDYN